MATQTVRDLLIDNPNGLSRAALLAWARLRIDPSMTESALEAEIAALGDEVEDRDGFLRLRGAGAPDLAEDDDEEAGPEPEPTWASSPGPEARPAGSQPVTGWIAPGGSPAAVGSDEMGAPVEVPAEWQAPQQSLGRSRVLIAVVVLAVIGAAIVGQTLLGGETVDASDLSVGDCIEVPEASEFSELGQTACDEAHTGEVFFVGDHPDGADAAFPSDDAFFEWVGGVCDPAFRSYTGAAYEDQTTLDYGYFTPTADGWEAGDREVICYLALADFSETDQSWKDAFP